MSEKTILFIDKRKFVDYKVSIQEEHVMFFEFVMKSHGWRTVKKGEHKNHTISIDIDRMIWEEK